MRWAGARGVVLSSWLLAPFLVLVLLCHRGVSAQVQQGATQVKTRNLKGPANQPWKCKRVKVRGNWHGHYLHDKTFINWECENTEVKQQVFEMTIHTRPSSEVYDNINNVFGLAKSMSSTGVVTFLGKFDKLDDCELACFKFSSGGAKCTAYTWHRRDFGDPRWARQCFAVLDGRWSPVRQQGAVSGKVMRESNSLQDASGRGCLGACSGHGVCQNTTGVCICDIGFEGFDCSLELGCDSPAVEGRCYSVFARKTSWHKAEQRCAKAGGSLAIVTSPAQQKVLASVLGGCQRSWIGLSDHEEEGRWQWADRITRSNYRNWAVGEPNNKGNEDFVLMHSLAKENRWADSKGASGNADCYACSYRDGATSAHHEREGACVRDCSGHGSCGAVTGTCSCDDGYFGNDCSKRSPCEGTVLGDKCYVVYAEEGDRRAAEDKCRSRGGQLSSVVSDEHEKMLLLMGEDRGCRAREMWIGLNDEEREGMWEWADREMTEADYVNWVAWEPNNGAVVAGGVTRRQEDGVILDRYGWSDAEVTRSNVTCFACQFDGSGIPEAPSSLTRLGQQLLDPPVLFNYFAADQDPVLRRVSCVPATGKCIDEEGEGGMEPLICAAAPDADADEDEWEDVPEGEEGDGEWEEGEGEGESAEEEEDDEEGNKMPAAATMEVGVGKCRAPLDLMTATAERCWRSCWPVMERFGEDASDSCRQTCFRMAGQINEDMSLVASGEGGDVVEYYASVNISDPSKVGTQGSTEEKKVRTDALVNNVWAAAVLVGRMAEAEKHLIKLLKVHPDLMQLHYTLAVGFAVQGRLQEAKAEYRRCIRTEPDKDRSKRDKTKSSDAPLLLAHCRAGLSSVLIKQGHYEQALPVLLAGVDDDPWFAPLHSALAAVRIHRAEPALALTHALEAVDLRRDVVHYRMQAALAARMAGRGAEGLRVLQEGLQLLPLGDLHQEATLHLVLAELSQRRIHRSASAAEDGAAGARAGIRRFRAALCTDRCAWQTGATASLYGEGAGVIGIPVLDDATRATLRHYHLAARALRKQRAVFDQCQRRALRGAASTAGAEDGGEEEEEEEEEEEAQGGGGRKERALKDGMSQQEWQRRQATIKSRNSPRRQQEKEKTRLAREAREQPPPPPRHKLAPANASDPAKGGSGAGDKGGLTEQKQVAAEKAAEKERLALEKKQKIAAANVAGWREYVTEELDDQNRSVEVKYYYHKEAGLVQWEKPLGWPPPEKGPTFEASATQAALLKCGKAPPLTEILRVRSAIADVFAVLGGWEEALAGHVAILAVRESHVPSLLGKAVASAALLDYAAVGHAVETAKLFGLDMNLAPSEVKVVYGMALMEHGREQIKKSKWRESQDLLRAAIKVDSSRTMPYAVDAWRLLCRSYKHQNKPESALHACTRAHTLASHLGDVLENIEWATKKVRELEKFREGRERLERQERERKAKEEQKKKEEKKDEWKWFGGDGEWHTGRGGGRGNKQGGGSKSKSKASNAKTAPRGLYDILELKPTCKKADIKRAYHKLSLKYHPDKNPDKKDTAVDENKVAAEKFREIAVAYQELLARHVDRADDEPEPHCINC